MELTSSGHLKSNSPDDRFSWFPMSRRYTFESNFELATHTADLWADSSILMHRLLKGTGAMYIHILQPNQWYRPGFDYLPKDPDHLYGWVKEPVNKFYPLFLNRVKKLRVNGVFFVDATRAFKDQDRDVIFADDCCHYNPKGYEILFNVVGTKLLNHTATHLLSN